MPAVMPRGMTKQQTPTADAEPTSPLPFSIDIYTHSYRPSNLGFCENSEDFPFFAMAKKRKSDATRLDEVDRTLYTTFSSAANSLSHLYSQAMNHQKLSFQAGERHSLEKLYNWILRQQEGGARVGTNDILAYIQNELDHGTEEPPPSPRLPFQQQQSQTAMQTIHSGFPVSANLFGPANTRSMSSDNQAKNYVFSNALSSPVRRSLQHYHLAQRGNSPNHVIRNENTGLQSRDPNPPSSNDTSMEMHADSPDHNYPC